jgi:hypothetical protein
MTWHANGAPDSTTPGLGYLRKEENKRIEWRPGGEPVGPLRCLRQCLVYVEKERATMRKEGKNCITRVCHRTCFI